MKKPMPKDFIAAFKDLSSRHNWTKEKVNSCQRCEGTGWVDTSITNIETLEHRNVMKSCPGCRSDTGMKDGWIEDVPVTPKSENKATNWMLNEIEQDYYSPKAAQDLLVKIDEEKINFPEEVVKALVEKAGK
jgi:DnaJ-class molecular chaperone